MKHPEARFVVEVTLDDEIVCRAPKQTEQRIKMADLAAVYVETNDSGPWGTDVWWLLNDNTGQTQVTFPQFATGEEAALERLRLLPGFEVRGMNSGENARFMCWPKPAPCIMTVNKLALFKAAKSLWPATIDLTKDPDGPHDIYWALERIVPVDDDWQQIAMWSFHQALNEMEKRAAATGVLVIEPHAVQFADFDKCMRSNLAGDECWAMERAFWESGTEQEQ